MNALISYENFKYERYLTYEKHPFNRAIWRTWSTAFNVLPINIKNDAPERFEMYVMGGVLDANMDEAIWYRTFWVKQFSDIDFGKGVRMVENVRGMPNNCKIVLFFDNNRASFIEYLDKKGVSYYKGYRIAESAWKCKKAVGIAEKIIELPIDPNNDRMQYLYNCVDEFFRDAKQ